MQGLGQASAIPRYSTQQPPSTIQEICTLCKKKVNFIDLYHALKGYFKDRQPSAIQEAKIWAQQNLMGSDREQLKNSWLKQFSDSAFKIALCDEVFLQQNIQVNMIDNNKQQQLISPKKQLPKLDRYIQLGIASYYSFYLWMYLLNRHYPTIQTKSKEQVPEKIIDKNREVKTRIFVNHVFVDPVGVLFYCATLKNKALLNRCCTLLLKNSNLKTTLEKSPHNQNHVLQMLGKTLAKEVLEKPVQELYFSQGLALLTAAGNCQSFVLDMLDTILGKEAFEKLIQELYFSQGLALLTAAGNCQSFVLDMLDTILEKEAFKKLIQELYFSQGLGLLTAAGNDQARVLQMLDTILGKEALKELVQQLYSKQGPALLMAAGDCYTQAHILKILSNIIDRKHNILQSLVWKVYNNAQVFQPFQQGSASYVNQMKCIAVLCDIMGTDSGVFQKIVIQCKDKLIHSMNDADLLSIMRQVFSNNLPSLTHFVSDIYSNPQQRNDLLKPCAHKPAELLEQLSAILGEDSSLYKEIVNELEKLSTHSV